MGLLCPLNLIRIISNYGYFTTIVPFVIRRSTSTGRIYIHTSLFQEILSAVTNLIGLLHILVLANEILRSEPTNEESGRKYFQWIVDITFCIYDIAFVFVIWTGRTAIRTIIEDYGKRHSSDTSTNAATSLSLEESHVSPQSNNIAGTEGFCTCSFIGCVLCSLYFGVTVWGNYSAISSMVWDDQPWTWMGVVNLCIKLARDIRGYYADVYFMGIMVMVYDVGNHFSAKLQGNAAIQSNPDSVFREYESVKRFMRNVNDAYYLLTSSLVLLSIPFFAIGLISIGSPNTYWLTKILLILFGSNFAFAFLLAANLIVQIGALVPWLGREENILQVPITKQNIILHELSQNMVGVKGGRMFTISYSFIGFVSNMIITYAVIALKLNQQEYTYF